MATSRWSSRHGRRTRRKSTWLFCENETNVKRLFNMDGAGPFKDGFNDYIVQGDREGDPPRRRARARRRMRISNWSRTAAPWCIMRWRPESAPDAVPLDVDALFARRIAEADEFYGALQHDIADADAAARAASGARGHAVVEAVLPVRRARAGSTAIRCSRSRRKAAGAGRNADWRHLCNADIVSMPDKWEYPWYASWDLAFHAAAFALIDPEFAKRQLLLLVKDRYQHPNGQLPAYEWAFGDANPPVHAWATWRVYEIDRAITGKGDRDFLELVFHKLLLNFSWWVNRKDADGHNIFQGGFLGLDNVGIFDRSSPLPTGGHIDQADGTAWMAAYALDLMRIALELAYANHVFVDIAREVLRALPVYRGGGELRGRLRHRPVGQRRTSSSTTSCACPTARNMPMRVRSIVGLIPLFAVHVLEQSGAWRAAGAARAARAGSSNIGPISRGWCRAGTSRARATALLLSLLRGHRMKALLRRMLDESRISFRSRRAGAVARASRQAVRVPSQRRQLLHPLSAGGIGLARVRRQFELARAGVDAGELSADRIAVRVSSLLRRRVPRRVSDRLGAEVLARANRR